MQTPSDRSGEFWDKEVIEPTHNSWMVPVQTRHYINELITGRQGGWPLDWLEEWLGGRRFDLGLSVGCGTGALERDLLQRNICQRIDAFDGSAVSIEIAKEQASSNGLDDRLNYYVADFNNPDFPVAKYDAVFFHQSAHHVGKLEKLFLAVLKTARPGAIVYFDEFIGPSRTDWNYQNLERWNEVYQKFPRDVRFFDRLPLPIQYDDVSEAARSAEILEQLRIGFEILALRGYGGNVLSMMYPGLNPGLITEEMIAEMIALERSWLDTGEPSFHAIFIASPKTNRFARLLAQARYFLEPKLKRAGRELARTAGGHKR